MLLKHVTNGFPLIPIFSHGLCAGFPSPADDYIEDKINLEKFLMPNAPATYLWRVNGHSMQDAGIFDGDYLVVDRSLKPSHNDVVVAIVNGEKSLKRLLLKEGRAHLSFENSSFPEYIVAENADVEIWGVVRCNIHFMRKKA